VSEPRVPAAPQEQPSVAEDIAASLGETGVADSAASREALTESSAPTKTAEPAADTAEPRVAAVEERRIEPTPAAAPAAPAASGDATALAQRDLERYKALMSAIGARSAASKPEPEPQPATAEPQRPALAERAEREAAVAEAEPPRRREMGAYQPEADPSSRTATTEAGPSSLDSALARYNALYERAARSTIDEAPEASPLKQELDEYRARVEASPDRTSAKSDELWASMLEYDQSRDRSGPRRQRRPAEPWSLGADLDKYRAHAVREGARDSGESLARAGERAGLALEDGLNVFALGYASERGEPFRGNDGRGLLDDPGAVPARAGHTLASMGSGVYSLADLITLDALSDIEADVYWDNDPLVRPFIFTGRTIGGVWKTTEEVGNALTWGYFDNVTGAAGMCIEDILEFLKHTAEAATNLVRGPVYLVAGRNEKTDKMLDWVLLVPPEFASNVVAMQGIANMEDYETAFADKGVIGSVLELSGSAWLTYEALDELCDELDDDDSHSSRRQSSGGEGPSDPGTPPTEPGPPTVIPPADFVIIIYPDGTVFTSG
jgi:hypothetical protein